MEYTLDGQAVKFLLNKYVIVGLTYVDENEKVLDTIQLHGRIVRINLTEGVVVRREDKYEEYMFPPDLSAFEPAKAGEYRLAKTGEVILDPDFMSTWTIQKPRDNKNKHVPL